MDIVPKLAATIKPEPGKRAVVQIGQRSIALFNVAGNFLAIDDSCPHAGASLAGGKVEHGAVQCPAHGLRFDLSSGRMCSGPLAIRTYPVSQQDGCLTLTLHNSKAP
jgi:3-phenylpropionate/trans-cinnamate dioxygenase ferredoxin subunit